EIRRSDVGRDLPTKTAWWALPVSAEPGKTPCGAFCSAGSGSSGLMARSPTRQEIRSQKKSPRVAPRGKVGWWRKSTYTTIDTWYDGKVTPFWINNARNCSGEFLGDFRRYLKCGIISI